MTEGRFRELCEAVIALKESLARRAPRLGAIAARLREYEPPLGLDFEADELEAFAREMKSGMEHLQRQVDGLLDETLEMLVDEVVAGD